MLVIHASKSTQKCTPNLLPAHISHNGPANDTDRYWKPEKDEAGNPHAYFRGRHLQGTTLALPPDYTGAVLHVTEKDLPSSTSTNTANNGMVDDEENEGPETKVADKVGEFDEVVIWGHGGPVGGSEDVYVKGMTEWITFSEAMHDSEGEQGEDAQANKAS